MADVMNKLIKMCFGLWPLVFDVWLSLSFIIQGRVAGKDLRPKTKVQRFKSIFLLFLVSITIALRPE
jgi:hypothetical protein